jgi:hypothetical protein
MCVYVYMYIYSARPEERHRAQYVCIFIYICICLYMFVYAYVFYIYSARPEERHLGHTDTSKESATQIPDEALGKSENANNNPWVKASTGMCVRVSE